MFFRAREYFSKYQSELKRYNMKESFYSDIRPMQQDRILRTIFLHQKNQLLDARDTLWLQENNPLAATRFLFQQQELSSYVKRNYRFAANRSFLLRGKYDSQKPSSHITVNILMKSTLWETLLQQRRCIRFFKRICNFAVRQILFIIT